MGNCRLYQDGCPFIVVLIQYLTKLYVLPCKVNLYLLVYHIVTVYTDL